MPRLSGFRISGLLPVWRGPKIGPPHPVEASRNDTRRQPFAKPAQRFPGARALRVLRSGCQLETTPEFSRREGRSSRFAQPPGFCRQEHQPPEIRAAS